MTTKTNRAARRAAAILAAAGGAGLASPAFADPGHGAPWDHLHGPEALLWLGLAAALTCSIALLARRG